MMAGIVTRNETVIQVIRFEGMRINRPEDLILVNKTARSKQS